MNFNFKKIKTKEERIKIFNEIIKKNPSKIPIICEKDSNSNLKGIDKTRYLVSGDLTVSQFMSLIRKKINLHKEYALFLLVKGKRAITGLDTMSDLYKKYKDEDGFLYISYTCEMIWGNI